MPKCPVCNNEASVLSPEVLHCGKTRCLSEPEDHYLSFWQLPEKMPEKGCPICGRPMKNIGPLKAWLIGFKMGLERMYCDQLDHYAYVTKEWYEQNRR